MIIVLIFIVLIILINNTGIGYKEIDNSSYLTSSKILDGAESFEYVKGQEKAVLFIHGFPGSPKMYYLARDLAIKSGYDVYVPRIPGFGSDENEFIKTNFSMWFSFIKNYYINIRTKYKYFYIVGNSMGGALTLKLSQEFSDSEELKPTAIAAISTPVYINSIQHGVLKTPIIYVLRYFSLFISYIKPKTPQIDKSLDRDGETEWVGYRGQFPKQVYSFYIALKKIKRELKKIDVPCYLCQATGDKTVSFKNQHYINSHISSNEKLIRIMNLDKWNHSNHSMFIYKSVVDILWSDINYFFENL